MIIPFRQIENHGESLIILSQIGVMNEKTKRAYFGIFTQSKDQPAANGAILHKITLQRPDGMNAHASLEFFGREEMTEGMKALCQLCPLDQSMFETFPDLKHLPLGTGITFGTVEILYQGAYKRHHNEQSWNP